jgi:predicted transcriptional regulator
MAVKGSVHSSVQDTIPKVSRSDDENSKKMSVKLTDVLAEIQNRHLLKTIQEKCFHMSQLAWKHGRNLAVLHTGVKKFI